MATIFQLRSAAEIEEPAERALEVVAIVGEALGGGGLHPVVVGGMALYFWTANEASLTMDIDVVVPTTEQFSDVLTALDFTRSVDGRHWELRGTEILVEAPASELDEGATVELVETPSGRTVSVLSHLDVLLDRLGEFQATGHQIVGQQVLVLLATLPEGERAALEERAQAKRVGHALKGVTELADSVSTESCPAPEMDEWHKMARLYEQSEYRSEL